MSDREATIDRLWEASGHGTRREDVVAAFEAGEASARAERALCEYCGRELLPPKCSVCDNDE